MRKMPWMLVIALCAGSCGELGGDDTADGDGDGPGGGTNIAVNRSGSRIKMNVLNTPDGAKSFASWRDTQLDLDCAFGLAADGATRCLPTGGVYLVANTYFGDAACTIPVAVGSGCPGAEPGFIYQSGDGMTCAAGGARVFRTGTKYTTAYIRSGASCIVVPASPQGAYYGLGAEMAPSMFQSATSAVE